jgi:hypothetical protein
MTRIDWIPLPKLWLLFILATLALAGCGTPSSQSNQTSQTSHEAHSAKATPAAANPTPRIPAYFDKLEEAMPLPQVLNPKQFSSPVVARAYGYARENPELFALQPCYCYCDQGNGHRSLLDCYATDHSAG